MTDQLVFHADRRELHDEELVILVGVDKEHVRLIGRAMKHRYDLEGSFLAYSELNEARDGFTEVRLDARKAWVVPVRALSDVMAQYRITNHEALMFLAHLAGVCQGVEDALDAMHNAWKKALFDEDPFLEGAL